MCEYEDNKNNGDALFYTNGTLTGNVLDESHLDCIAPLYLILDVYGGYGLSPSAS